MVKSEPSDPVPTPIIHQHPSTSALNIYSPHQVTQPLAQTGDKGMQINYQEEDYEDYGQYEAEEEYTDHVGTEATTKGGNIICIIISLIFVLNHSNMVLADEIIQMKKIIFRIFRYFKRLDVRL